MHSIGMDIGYTTLKTVVLNEKKEVVFQNEIFHHGNVKKNLLMQLSKIKEKFNIQKCSISFIGEQGKVFQKKQVNNILALVEGTLHKREDIQSIVEIGAQGSMFITDFSKKCKGNIKYSQNSSCSAGTGSFLEEQISRLGISFEEYNTCIKNATQVPRIAGRCSVFSKTDMIHHQQEGIELENILLGLAYALVRNFKSNVVQRLKVTTPVIIAGGVAKNTGVIQAFKEVFELEDQEVIIPNDCTSIGALGTALIASKSEPEDLITLIKEIEKIEPQRSEYFHKPLFKYGDGEFLNKHTCKVSNDKSIEGYVGIDIGSTSANLVVIDQNNEIVAYRYLKTKGNSKQTVEKGLESIKEEFQGKLCIKGVGTTGSGRKMIGDLLSADMVVNEITAQAKGAVEFVNDVDTIFEIGGQDSKYISIKNGRVVDFEMNKICAAGTGSFLEEQAHKLSIPIEEYSDVALKGEKPLDLGDRCTVFIEGNISNAISKGNQLTDIAAGLSYSIVNNYLNRVVANKPIGNKILLQGGIAYNQAVINAFKSVTGKKIIIPPFFSVTGAFGAALITKEETDRTQETRQKETGLNMEEEIEKLFLNGYDEKINPEKPTIGIPRVLFLHKLFPLFNTFFKTLGYNVLLSPQTDEQIIQHSQAHSLDETCYPMKLVYGHVAYLIEKGVDYIFLPSLYTMKHSVSLTREDYACGYMQTVPQIIAHVMDLDEKGIQLLSPVLSFKFGKQYMMETLLKLGKALGKNKIQTALALKKGMHQFTKFNEQIEALGQNIIENVGNYEKVFVMITRTYGIADQELNMKIPQKLRQMGYKVLTLSNLPAHDIDLSEDYPNMYWPFGQHILSGAKIISEHKQLYAIYLTNHGCGPDTILNHYFKEEMRGKPYLHIEVDEHASSVGVMTRLEAFVDSLKSEEVNEIDAPYDKVSYKGHTHERKVFLPNLFPYSNILCEILRKQGVCVDVLPATNTKSLEVGKQLLNSKEYLSLAACIGDVFSNLDKMLDGNTFWLPQTEGNEAFGQYGSMIEHKLNEKNKKIKIESPFIEDLLEDDKYGIDFAFGMLAGDIIMTAHHDKRNLLLEEVLEHIDKGKLSKKVLCNLAHNAYKNLAKKDYKHSIFVIGEPMVVLNPHLNNYQLEKLESNHKVYYQPISEMLYFRWSDFLKKEKKDHRLLKMRLDDLKECIKDVSKHLDIFSPFDEDIDSLIKKADDKLPFYSGGNGRYRIAKMFRGIKCMNGMLSMSSMYENTGTILKILKGKDQQELGYPIIELFFDGSKHSDNDEKIENFIYLI